MLTVPQFSFHPRLNEPVISACLQSLRMYTQALHLLIFLYMLLFIYLSFYLCNYHSIFLVIHLWINFIMIYSERTELDKLKNFLKEKL